MRLALLALPALAVARLLPEEGAGLYLRLATATLVVLLPGLLAARALGLPAGSGALAWSLFAVAAGLAVAVVGHTGLWPVLVALALAALGAAPRAWRAAGASRNAGAPIAVSAGVVLGLALWPIAGGIEGDALFHLARVRKLAELPDLSLAAVGEFADGGLHPGYAFPLWHAFLGAIAWVAGVDPSAVVLHGSSVLAPLAVLVAYEAGLALFRSPWLAGAAAAGQVTLIALSPGGGGAYRVLELPATSSRQLLVPASLALVFAAVRSPRPALLASVAAAGLALTLVHPTYSLFLLVPLAGFWAARALLARSEGREVGLALAAFAAPTAAAVAALVPVARTTASYRPSAEVASGPAHGVARYTGQLDVFRDDLFRVAPELVARAGAIAVAGLLLVPLAALAARRRWSAFVLGGSVAVLAVVLVPWLFTPLSDAVSLSQSRRLAGFVPFAFAFAGGIAVLARLLGPLVLPAALAAGVALQLAWPGDFDYVLSTGGPAGATWIAAFGGAAALAAAAVLRPRRALERDGPLVLAAALLFVLPAGIHAVTSWEGRDPARPPLPDPLVERLPARAVVLSDPETSYRLLAQAPVYVVAAPPAHVADTEKNRPRTRARTVARFLRTGDLAIPRRAHAGWILLDRRHFETDVPLEPVYRDQRYDLYRLE